jgi:hypothetical protein
LCISINRTRMVIFVFKRNIMLLSRINYRNVQNLVLLFLEKD